MFPNVFRVEKVTMKRISILLMVFACVSSVGFASVIEDLSEQIVDLRDGDIAILDYQFRGCYGPYHRGTIEMQLVGDEIHYTSRSFDDKGNQALAQAGKYKRKYLIKLLDEAAKEQRSEVYGNTIEYKINASNRPTLDGADKIEQRHFIEIFEPFTSIFKPKEQDIIPRVSSGGFVK